MCRFLNENVGAWDRHPQTLPLKTKVLQALPLQPAWGWSLQSLAMRGRFSEAGCTGINKVRCHQKGKWGEWRLEKAEL